MKPSTVDAASEVNASEEFSSVKSASSARSVSSANKPNNANSSSNLNDGLCLRLATSSDIPFLCAGALQLAQQEIMESKLTLSEHLDKELINYYQLAIETPSMLLLMAEQANENTQSGFLVGAISPSPNTYTTMTQFASVHTLWIEPVYRHRGIARLLVQAFEATVQEHGIDIVDVAHVASNVVAETFWQSLGYDTVSITRRKNIRSL